jgi:hypothetical protein
MPQPNRGPRGKKGWPIRVRNPPFVTGNMQNGKMEINTPNKIVYQGPERRGTTDQRDPQRDRRYEWRTLDPKKKSPTVWGRRLTPARKYEPTKYSADRGLPKKWFTEIKSNIDEMIQTMAKENKTSQENAWKILLAQLPKGFYITTPPRRHNGKEYLISFNPADRLFYWSSTRRTMERRGGDRRSPFRVIENDPSIN